jgi:hypothetical protein
VGIKLSGDWTPPEDWTPPQKVYFSPLGNFLKWFLIVCLLPNADLPKMIVLSLSERQISLSCIFPLHSVRKKEVSGRPPKPSPYYPYICS